MASGSHAPDMNSSPFQAPWFQDPNEARRFLEDQRWPDGVVCPHCGTPKQACRIRSNPRRQIRPGLWKCGACGRQFTVTVGTILKGSHLPLHLWLQAIQILCGSVKGASASELRKTLGITSRSALVLVGRIREATARKPLRAKLRASRLAAPKPEARAQPVSLWPLELTQAVSLLLCMRPLTLLERMDRLALIFGDG